MRDTHDQARPADQFEHQHAPSMVSGKDEPSVSHRLTKFLRRYLTDAEPARMLVHALVIYLAARLLVFMSAKMLETARMTTVITSTGQGTRSGAGFAMLLSESASVLTICAGVLMLWAIARLIADAIAGRTPTNG